MKKRKDQTPPVIFSLEYINELPAINNLESSCYKHLKQVLVENLKYLLRASYYVPVQEIGILMLSSKV